MDFSQKAVLNNIMNNYFTSIEKINNQFIGTVHDSSNNHAIYRTQQFNTHAEAIMDVNRFLQTTSNSTPQTITSTAIYSAPAVTTAVQSEPQPIRRCCGR